MILSYSTYRCYDCGYEFIVQDVVIDEYDVPRMCPRCGSKRIR